MADFSLADAVNTAKALFDPVRIPRQVVVDHQMGTLEVDTLTGRVRRQKHLNLGVVPKGFLYLQALLAANTAVDDDHGLFPSEQRRHALLQIVQRVAVLGKDDELLMR